MCSFIGVDSFFAVIYHSNLLKQILKMRICFVGESQKKKFLKITKEMKSVYSKHIFQN